MGDWRWIGKDGFEYFGDEAKLRQALAKKEVGLSTLVWPDGSDEGEGVPLGTTPEFAPPKTMPLASHAPLVREEATPFYEPEPDSPTELDNAPPGMEPEPSYAPPPEPQQPYFQPSEPPAAAYRSPPPRRESKSMVGILLALGVFVLGSAVVIGALVSLGVFRSGSPKPAPAADGAASTSSVASKDAPKAAGFSKCSADAPKRVSETALGRVALDAVDLGARAGLGFAEDEHTARSLSFDPATLEATLGAGVKSKGAIAAVAATAAGTNVELTIDVSESELKSSKTVLGTPPFRIGTTKDGVAIRRGEQTSIVWPGDMDKITVPRVETIAGAGHFVSFRRGTKELQAGWLELDGKKKTDLATIPFDARALGTPSVALSANGVLVMVAARTTSPNWIIAAARATVGSLPSALSPLSTGDTDAPNISPSAAALPNDQWAIQWTTGPSDAHVVHVAIFDKELKRVVDPVAVSASGTDAGQGVVWSNGKEIVSFFLVSTKKTHELWVARLKCE